MALLDRNDSRSKPDFSNVESGSSTTAPSAPTSAPQYKTYVVVKGDNLSKIAKREYGRAEDWRKIFEANKDTIKNPDLIRPGQTLKIPTS